MSSPRTTIEALRSENAALRRALRLLFDVANLARAADDPEATMYAVLTGVTAGVGLGLNRAMIFERAPDEPRVLVGRAAIGPASRDEADRVWRSIERDQPDLETLYEAGLRQRETTSELARRVRAVRIDLSSVAYLDNPVALATERVVVAEGHDDLDGLLDPATTIAAPMRDRDGLRGVLIADNRFTGIVPDAVARMVFTLVADHAGRALWAADRYARVAAEARTDALTGLDARRVGLARLDYAAGRALTEGTRVALLLLDLDHFKRVNDTYGHPAGDAVLAEVARRVRAALARGERAFRYGGEEIGLILEGGASRDPIEAAERVRAAIAAEPITITREAAVRVTGTIGIAITPPHEPDSSALLQAADEALLRAKREGRDRVVVAHPFA